ncbi:hsp70 [Fusarium beomiforme]|uniref:Hsp70 n=1 Tax=Fusarium beomiforme TaxID=44412 RepID=A0A9P5DWI1_9HYPO|nr:hsp70 [Fusarium beomiforme]
MEDDKSKIADRKIIVGIDFGTTYSGVAWAESRNPSRRTCITRWPVSIANKEGEYSDKVPTKLRYKGDKLEWGFSIPINAPQHEAVEWFKLPISTDRWPAGKHRKYTRWPKCRQTRHRFYLPARRAPSIHPTREAGNGIVDNTPLEFHVTVPAIWSDLAKDKTKKACEEVGISAFKHHVHLVSEPEAAAIYALNGIDPHGLKVVNTIIVVDAGGGTVDLISYTILRLKPILEVQEAAPGSGGLCGSTFLNQSLSKFLPGRLGLANNKSLGISRGRFALKASDVKNIFEPVVQEVIRLVKDQVTASSVPVHAILLVGGLGSSNYLKERLWMAVDRSVQIMQPPYAWQAIVQGAVIRGLAQSDPYSAMVKVTNRKARKHYGTEWSVRWREKVHGSLKSKRYWCGLDGCYKVEAMWWFITRGSTVSENEPYCTSAISHASVSKGRIKMVRVVIYNDRLFRDAPVFRDENVRMFSIVEADVSHIPENQIGRRKCDEGEWHYELSYKIEAVYLSACMTYTLICNNQRFNTVTCEYV